MDAVSKAIEGAPSAVRECLAFVPGKPIDQLRRERGIADDIEIVKLASNENAFGPSQKVKEAFRNLSIDFERYPDPGRFALHAALAKHHSVPHERIHSDNGSDSIISTICRSLVSSGQHVVINAYSFPIYELALFQIGADVTKASLTAGFEPQADVIIESIQEQTRLVIIGNPDNPGGQILSIEDLTRIYEALPEGGVLVVDEAYDGIVTAEGYQSTLSGSSPLNDGKRAVVTTRTFSKGYGLAALRVGYAVAPERMIQNLFSKLRLAFSVNTVGQHLAAIALSDQEHVDASRRHIEDERPRVVRLCRECGFEAIEGVANFFLLRKPGVKATTTTEELLDQGVIVRPLMHPEIDEYFRVSVGTELENERFLHALSSSVL